jgi:peptidoglycan/LPS O-acetylase OafA/YrhL
MNTLNGKPNATNHAGNAFDLIRFLAAFGVLYSHSFPLTGLPEPKYFAGFSLGTICVFVFFAISGTLVMRSWNRSPTLSSFFRNRVLRIFPGLAMCLVITAFVVGPLVSTVPFSTYFSRLSPYQFVLSNLVMFIPINGTILDVFHTVPYPDSTNGSLWTIRYEIFMYIVLAFLCAIFKKNAVAVTVLLLSLCSIWLGGKFAGMQEPGALLWHLHAIGMGGVLLKLAPFFLIGAILGHMSKDAFRPLLACLGLTIAYFFNQSEYGIVALWATLPYAILAAAYHMPKIFHRFGKYGDFSYGIYLYAFPVQQTLSSLGVSTWWLHLLISSVITMCLAVVSWKLVEAPSLRLKHRTPTAAAGHNATSDLSSTYPVAPGS